MQGADSEGSGYDWQGTNVAGMKTKKVWKWPSWRRTRTEVVETGML